MGNRNLRPQQRQFFEKFIHKMHFYNLNCAWSGKPQNLKRQILKGKIPVHKSRCLQPNQNQKFGKNITRNQKYDGNKALNPRQNFVKENPKKPPKPNTPGSSDKLHDPIKAQCQEKKLIPEPKSLNQDQEVKARINHHSKVSRSERDERKDRHRRHSSVSSSSSDNRCCRSKKHHKRRKHVTSSSESESYSHRRRSPSRGRSHHHRSKEHKKSRGDRRSHRRHRYSSVSSDSSSSYDRYRKKGRKYHSRRSYSSSDTSSSERYEKKYSSRYAENTNSKKADDDSRHLAKRMSDMSLDHRGEQSSSRRK